MYRTTQCLPTEKIYDLAMPVISTLLPRSRASGGTSCSQLRPLQVTWEVTRNCEWKTTHARASVRSPREKQEFSTAEAFHLIEQVASMHVPLLVLTGGDPLLRPDLLPVIEFASRRSVRTSLTLLPTPLLGADVISELRVSGLMRVAFWLHGSTAAMDDSHWPISGSHKRTLDVIQTCHEVGLPVQINTMMTRRNLHDVEPMIDLLTRLDVVLWNVIFLVPADREHAEEMLSAEEHEQVFAKLYAASSEFTFRSRQPRRNTTSDICCRNGRASHADA